MFKKISKYLFMALIFLCIPAFLTGCARFDKTAYVQAALDSIYKGDHLKFSEITGTDISELENNYINGIDAETASFLNYIGIGDYTDKVSPEVKKEISYLLRQIYKHASYSVGAENNDGQIPVKILPISLYSVSGDKITDYMQEEFYSQYVKGILDIISESMNAIGYSNEVTINVSIERNGAAYSISEDSFAEIDCHILDYTM